MKLVELLALEVSKWPKGAKNITQDSNGAVSPCTDPHGDLKFCGSRWTSTNGFQIGIDILGKNDLASDYKTAIVTREMWQAERDRQKGGEWKRHRGGRKQPIEDGVKIEVRWRNGEVYETSSQLVDWVHYGASADIMAFRVISQPQADGVEVKDTTIGTLSYKVEIDTTEASQALDALAAKWDQIDGPIKWRDTIIHCQAIIEDCEREIQRNVDLLDAEGLMMQTDSKKAMQHYVPSIDSKDWKIGDILEIITNDGDSRHEFKVGEQVRVSDIDDSELPVKCYHLDNSDFWYIQHHEAKFIRRP